VLTTQARVAAARRSIAAELRPTLTLACPVIASELGWIAMGVVDIMIVGRLDSGAVEAVGAVGLGSMVFFTIVVFGMGLLLGLDTLVSQAFGAGNLGDCHHSLLQAIYLAVALAPPSMLLVILGAPWLEVLGVKPDVVALATPYLRATAWSTFPLFIYAAFRRYLQAMGRVQVLMFALVTANVVNILGNWVLVFGNLGSPRMGVEGSGWATTVSRVYLALLLVIYTFWHDRKFQTGLRNASWQPDFARLRRLVELGLPAAVHVTLEVGVFAAATALAACLDAASLAAHQVVLNVSALTFMIPFGLGSAGAVRVGQALGRGEPLAAERAGWTTLSLAIAFMGSAAVVIALVPRAILSSITADPAVLAVGVSLMYVAAGFQLFDGIQGVTTGNLRGAGDTRTAMVAGVVAHWCIGLPVGYTLAFLAGLGAFGLWLGLSLGLVAASVVLLRSWILMARAFSRGEVSRWRQAA
jgi:MATE family multidrug resistance protein